MQEYQTNPGLYYFVNDHLGTPQRLVSGTGTVVWEATYLPYGQAQVKINTVANTIRFPGQYFDVETGLHYNWNRFYDPGTGSYLSADPIGLSGGMNLYRYVQNNPINFIDPYGLYTTFLFKQFVNRTTKYASGKFLSDIDPAGRRIVSAGIGGAAAGAVGGAIVGILALGIGAGPSAIGGSIAGFSGGLLIQTGLEAAGLGQAIEDLTNEVINNFLDAVVDVPDDGKQPCK